MKELIKEIEERIQLQKEYLETFESKIEPAYFKCKGQISAYTSSLELIKKHNER